MVAADTRMDIAMESDSFILRNAFTQGSWGSQVPEQLGSYNDVVAGLACELLMLLSLWVAFVVLDEVDDWGAPVGVEG